MIAPIAAELPQTPQSSPEPLALRSRSFSALHREPDMAFIDDATHTGRPLYDAPIWRVPRQLLTLAALATSLAIWAILILAVVGRF